MRWMPGIGGLIVRVLLLTALVHEAAEALDGGLLEEPAVIPDDGSLLPDPLTVDPAAIGPLPEPEPTPEPLPDPSPLPLPPPTGPAPGAHAIGRTAVLPAVLSTGEAALSLPLSLPPGTNGLTPPLSLEYRHRTPGGWIGVGWSLGGLSVITRCPRNLAQDGQAGPVRLSMADRFCLDGQRLVVIDGRQYGSAGAEYRTEIESYARVRSYGTAGAGPQHFVIERADGVIAEYGVTPDSRVDRAGQSPTPRAWALNRLRDRAGNVVDYRYVEDALLGSFRLAAISYNGNPTAGTAATHEISFAYETRPADDVDLHFVAGEVVRQVTRLVRVDVTYQGAVIRRYELGYESQLSTAGHSRLASIRECGRDGAACYPPTTLQWQDGTPGLGAERALSWSLGGAAWLEENKRWWIGDVNGDGRDDLVWSSGTTPTLRYRLGQATGVLGAEVNSGVPAPNGAGVPLDYDGDGIEDALLISAAGRWQVVKGSTAGLGAVLDTGIAASAIDYRGADLDGNGLSDLVYSEDLGGGGNGLVVRVRYNQPGAGFSSVPAMLYQQGFEAGYASAEGGNFLGRAGRRIDLDGDGREDLLLNEQYSIARISADESTSEPFDSSFAGGVPADINGDGCTDFAYPHYQGRWRVRFSGCQVAGSIGAEVAGPPYGVVRYSAMPLDWNGDGRDDLVFADSGTTWKVVRSSGDNLLPVLDSQLAHGSPTSTAVGDIDGDGLDDLVARAGTRVSSRIHGGLVPDLLLSSRDGFGVVAGFHYAPLTRQGVHARGQGGAFPQQDLQDARQVVTVLSVSDGSGTGSMAETSYQYAGLRRDLHGRGDLGFRTRVSTPASGDTLVVQESFLQGFPYTGLVTQQVVRRRDGALVRDVAQEWKALALGSGVASRTRPYMASQADRQFEPGGSSGNQPYRTMTQSVAAIDTTSGAVTDWSVTVTEGAGGTRPGSQHTDRYQIPSLLNDTTNWCIGRPQSLRRTASHDLSGGAALHLEQSVAWDGAACRPVSVTYLPGDASLQVIAVAEHDRFGNVSRSTITGAGMAARVTTVDWGPRGRFPTRVVRPLSLAWSATWNEADGGLVSWTDANGQVTRIERDNFGLPVVEVLPDGQRSILTREACGTGCDPRAAYRTRRQDLDSYGAVVDESSVDFDVFDRPVRQSMRMPGGGWSVEATEFDARGRLVRLDRPAWASGTAPGYWRRAYDELDRLVEVSLHAAGGSAQRSVRFHHDGLAVEMTDLAGRQTLRRSSAWGDVLDVQQPEGAALQYEHDGFGRLLRVRDEAGRSLSELAYNAAGMKTSQVDVDLGRWTFGWNALGELLSQRDARSQTTTFQYDLLGRLTRRVETEGVTTWTWGTSSTSRNVGHLAAVAGPGYSESYAYDANARLAVRTIKSDATYQYAFGWDAAGRLASLTYPVSTAGYRLKVGYDHEGDAVVRIRDLTVPGKVLWQLAATDAGGNVLDESLGSAVRVVAGYSPLTGEVEYQEAHGGNATVLQDLAYRWDDVGNLAERQDITQGVAERFSYDGMDRLVSVQRNGQPDLRLRYDPAGNITWKSDICPGTADCFAYDASRRHAVVAAGAGRYAYDANGNMTSRNGSAVSWYSYNLPKTIAAGANQSTFWYGPARNRWKQVAMDGGVTETTIYVGGLLDKVTRAGKTSWRHHVVAPTGIASVHVRHADGSPPRDYVLARDHLGSTSAMADGITGTLLARVGYDAFGQRRAGTGAGGPGANEWAAIQSVTRDGFTGHEHLDNIGLIHMNGRVYDPQLGRFLSGDPIVQSPFDRNDLNRYAYAWNNPLAFVDPTGLQEVSCLHGAHGRCQGVTVTGLRDWPAITPAYMALRFGSNGQVVSAAQRDPCGQDGSAQACARSARPDPETATGVGAGDYWRGFAASLGNLAMNSAPVFWMFGDDADYQWFPVPDNESGRLGARLGNVGYFVGGFAGAVRGLGGTMARGAAGPGQVVLGHYPSYVETAQRLGARLFNVPKRVWDQMSPEQQWAANQRFLDRVISRGDTVVLSTQPTRARPGSAFSRELEYLSRQGYVLADDGTRMVPGGP